MKPNTSPHLAAGKSGLLFAIISLFALHSGCTSMDSSSGTPIDSAKVAQIVKGKTTRPEIEVLFGKPEMTSLMTDGRRMISYSYTSTKMGLDGATAFLGPFAKVKGATRIQTLQIYVGKDGIVEDYEFSDNTRDIQGQGPNVKSTTR